MIDAGHGGDERGAAGAGGTVEKDITLSIARRLRTLIESRLGLRVFMTRDDDRMLTLDERSAYANSQKADVFVSIHANAAMRPTVKGAEVYLPERRTRRRGGAPQRRRPPGPCCRRSAAARARST